MSVIDVPDISSPDALHEASQVALAFRFHQEMNMIGHEDIGIEPCPAFAFGLSQTFQEDLIILLCKKDGLSIVAALDHVMGIGREAETRWTRHGWETSGTNEQCNLLRRRPAVNEIVL
jgi:hypothetical protein